VSFTPTRTGPPPAPLVAPAEVGWSPPLAARTARGGGELTAILALAGSRDTITFSGGFPAPETFPVDALKDLTARILTEDPASALQYTPTEGMAASREAVARFVAATQGTQPDPAGVLITSGGIEALKLISNVLLDPGDCVAVEAPTYLGALMEWAGAEARVLGVEMDGDGLVVDHLNSLLDAGERPKLLYVIPDHQNPTGLTLSADRRQALVDTCRRHEVLIVEDVAYRELGFDGRPLPSLWSLAPDTVVQIGTFSKIMFPGVRLGWAIGPRPVTAAMAAAKQNSDQCSGALGQTIMTRLVADDFFAAHLERSRRLYQGRAAAMLDALRRHMPAGVSWTQPAGGFFVWLSAAEQVDTRALVLPARRLKVAYVPGAPFYPYQAGANQMRLAYSGVPEAEIETGIERLSHLLTDSGEGPQ
jgi:2-aminoadipate transaminase